jgi:hypothetical protein
MAGSSGNKQGFSIHEQYAYMRQICPSFRCKVQNGRLSCSGTVQPFPFTEKYAVRISYRIGESPKVYVDKPALQRRKATEAIPHTYPGDRPCLFFPPDDSEWSSRKIIAQTIVPWLTEWLFYYEAWLSTGTWQGGGVHPDTEGKKESGLGPTERLGL